MRILKANTPYPGASGEYAWDSVRSALVLRMFNRLRDYRKRVRKGAAKKSVDAPFATEMHSPVAETPRRGPSANPNFLCFFVCNKPMVRFTFLHAAHVA